MKLYRITQKMGGLAIATLLGSALGSVQRPAFAQAEFPPINLVDIAKFYDDLPHQERALLLLQQQLNTLDPSLLRGDSVMANVWRDSEMWVGHVDILEQIPVADRTGTDPLNLALGAVSVRSGAPVAIEMLPTPTVESPDGAIVTLTERGVLDDSIAGIRYRFDLRRMGEQWEIRRAGRQVQCQPGRGHQDWSAAACI